MGPKKNKTRQSTKLLVAASELPIADLPTLGDVLGKCTIEKDKLPSTSKLLEVLPVVVKAVRDLYCKVNSNLVLHSDKFVCRKITESYEKMKYLNRSKSSGHKSSKFEQTLGKIFDIIVCKCNIVPCSEGNCSGCVYAAHCFCVCPLSVRIPKTELDYVMDQRSRVAGARGDFQISGKDLSEMEEMEKASKRKKQDAKSTVKAKETQKEWTKQVQPVTEDVEEEFDFVDVDTEMDPDFCIQEKVSSNRNTMVLRNLAKECDRWGVSPRAGAAIANAVLIDAAVITPENQKCVIDKSKLRRALEDYRSERQAEEDKMLEENQSHAYYFDGKKTKSLCVEEDEHGKKYNVYRELELISMSSEPGGLYVTHIEPEGGKGDQVADAVHSHMEEHKLAESWQIVGGDSTPANTGKYIGAFACLERKLNRKLLWSICMLHLNELPLRHVFVRLDGETASNNTFKGVIGKLLPQVESLDWKGKFSPVQLGPGMPELSEEVASDLSSDQRMLYLAFMSVWSGVIRPELYSLTPGPISHSRWLTLCVRILILFMKKHNLKGKNKKNLLVLVKFLISNYVPMWFTCKQHIRITDGPKHLFTQTKLIQVLQEPVLSVAKKNISQNAYWAHPEVLLLAMLADQDKIMRTRAVDKILSLRGDSDQGDDQPRLYEVPQLKFNAKCYADMIDWKIEKIYEPVITVKMGKAELLALKDSPLTLPRYPSNTQSVERLVAQTSRAAAAVAGFHARDGFLRASSKSRNLMPKFESKQDFENNFI